MSEQQKQNPRRGNMPPLQGKGKNPKFNGYLIYGVIFMVILGLFVFNSESAVKTISYSDFTTKILESGDIKEINIIRNQGIANITIKEDDVSKHKDLFGDAYDHINPKKGPHFSVNIPNMETFVADVKAATSKGYVIPTGYEDGTNYLMDIFSFIGPLLILLLIWMFVFRRMSGGANGGGGGGVFNVGKSRAQMFDKDSSVKVTFEEVAGLREAKTELEEIVAFLKKPEKYTDLGGKIPKGALLVGPPGTGKTLLAKAVAGEADVPFFSISGSDFVEMFVGVGASRVRDLFKKAKEKSPCIVFIDEIDAIGRARGKSPNMGSNDERENTLNQLLTEMDGFGTNSGIIILAATNRADILDKALMRAGRFDRQIHVDLPDLKEREQIFKVHLKPLKLSTDVKAKFMAKQTPGFSGADIANVCNEAALIAARNSKKIVDKDDFMSAVDRIVGGLEKRSTIITREEKRSIAIHESGHATINWLLEYAHPLVKVTIVPRGKALGAAWYLPEERKIITTEQLLDEMCATLGGRAAEEIIFGKISSGALNDLEKVTKQAYAMVVYYGMSPKIGNISYFDSTGQNEAGFTKPYSETTAQQIDVEVKNIIEEQYERAKQILTENKDKLNELANILIDKEVIFSEDMEAVFGKSKIKNRITEEDKKDYDDEDEAHDEPKIEKKEEKKEPIDIESRKVADDDDSIPPISEDEAPVNPEVETKEEEEVSIDIKSRKVADDDSVPPIPEDKPNNEDV